MIIAAIVGAFSASAVWMLARPFLLARPATPPRRFPGFVVVGLAAAFALAVSATLVDSLEDSTATAQAEGRPGVPGAEVVNSRLDEPTARELAAVDVAVERVRENPRSVAAHLALARAYAAARQPQLATVEYLAATRLDRDNAEANTALALVAFQSGNARSAKAMVDRALAADPDFPEALYTRGLVNAMGLNRPEAARRDFTAYLDAAPFGSHRLTVETLLALLDDGGAK